MRKITQSLLCLLIASAAAWAQVPAQAVNQTAGAPPFGVVQLFFYSGSNVVNICNAASSTNPTVFAVGGTPALTSVVVATNVGTVNFGAAAQFWVGQQITIAGSTTSALNGAYKVTAVSGTTATITTSGVMDGTYNNGAMTLTTVQPLLNALLWSIEVFTYSGSNVTGIYWAGTPQASTVPQNLACSNRGNY